MLLHAHASAQGLVEEPEAADPPESVTTPFMDGQPVEGKSTSPVKTDNKQEKPMSPVTTEGGMAVAVLRGLNKVTARSSDIVAPIGSVVRFGTLEIIAHSCWQSPPVAMPENAALLEISEMRQKEGSERIFLGWMFSSSPGLSSLENPFYDVAVIRCNHQHAQE